ncbi:Ff.00g096080.m01.CDS01 [Fusarium sp. VM40]|nr:Ff.00g096080.m01.CDS01 [Fusarium sp. VM40]
MTPNPSMSLQLADVSAGSYQTTAISSPGSTVSQDEIIPPQSGVFQIVNSRLSNIPVAATAFTRFKELPAEIRKEIWELSLNDPRVFWPNDARAGKYYTGVNFAHKPPAVRQVCRESRQVSQARGGFSFREGDSIMGGLWFDFFSDILYMFSNIGRDYTVAIHNTRNVALVWPDVRVLRNLPRMKEFIREYPKCRRIILISTAGHMDEWSDMEFYPLEEGDYIDYAPEDWASLKYASERFWREESARRYLGVNEK